MLIVVEGIDGCGKTTVAQTIARYLKCDCLHFPNDDGVTGPMIRDYLARRWQVKYASATHDELASALTFQTLQVANRMEIMKRLRAASHEESLSGRHLVLARYWQSGWVYGQLDGLDRKFLTDVNECMVQAQTNILLDVDANTAMARRAFRDGDKKPERYEERIELQSRAAELYLDLWDQHENDNDWSVVNASDSLPNVLADAIRLMAQAKEARN
jgi:dTMP kinase